jgi:Leucine-rich repeat (LRR) protein
LAVSGAGAAWELYRGQPEIPPPPVPASAQLTEQIAAIRDETAPGDTFGGGRIEIEDQPLSDADLEALRGLEGVRTLILDGGAISDAGLEVIATLPDLQHLRVRHSQITDAGVAALSACERLRVLNLPQANLTPDGVLTLRQVDSLRQLRLGGDGKVDLSRSVAQLHQLRAVHLINVPVSDEGLRALASLPRLESLYLDQPKVSEAGWDWLFHHHPHLHVHLNQTHHDRDPNWHAHGGDASESESAAMPR